jgi:integrase
MIKPYIKTKRHKDRIGWGKVLTHNEQRQVVQYLLGKTKGAISGEYLEQNTLDTTRLFLIYMLLVNTGLRETELAKLRVRDCPEYIGVDEVEVYLGKGNKDRSVPISPQVAAKINDYLKNWRPQTLPRWRQKTDISESVFFDNRRHRYFRATKEKAKKTGETKAISRYRDRTTTTFYRMIRRLGEEAGLTKRLHPHILRHTFAVNALQGSGDERPLDIYTVADMMGHSSIKITERYLHLVNPSKDIGKRVDYVSRFV